MKVQIKPGFLFPTQFWTVELNENIELLQMSVHYKKNDRDKYVKAIWFSGVSFKRYKRFKKSSGTNRLVKQIINVVNAIHQISRQGELDLTKFRKT